MYLHDGEQYEVLKLDLVSRTALAVPFYGNYYTVPSGTEDTRILQTFQKETFKRIKKCFGDINVHEVISMYKKLQFHNHQNLGYVSLTRPLQKDYDTESTWIEIPENIVDTYQRLLVPDQSGELVLNNHFEGISYAIKNMIGNITGMICDGAKPSCAMKVSSGVSTAMLSALMAMENKVVTPVEGIIDENVDKSIINLTSIGSKGMEATDKLVLDIMTGKSC